MRQPLGLIAGCNRRRSASAALEVLHGAFASFRPRARRERAEIAPPACLRIDFARIEPILARLELADHATPPAPAMKNAGRPRGFAWPPTSRRAPAPRQAVRPRSRGQASAP